MQNRSDWMGWKESGSVRRDRRHLATWLLFVLALAQLGLFPCALSAAEGELDLTTLARQSSPSVVLIEVFDGGKQPSGTGTGFFVDETTLVTNHHVIEGAHRARLRLAGGSTLEVSDVLAEDAAADLAVLGTARVPGVGLDLYDGPRVEPGEPVVVLGSPEGLAGTLSDGIVSAWRDRHEELAEFETPILQITAPISPGSSGSPVMNRQGSVVGVAVAVHRSGQALNFAVPVDALRALLESRGTAPVRALGEVPIAEQSVLLRNLMLSLFAAVILGIFLRRL